MEATLTAAEAQRLMRPVDPEVLAAYLRSRTPVVPATFRGPNWKRDES